MPTIAETCAALLTEHGPLTLDRLTELAVEAGATKAKKPRKAVEDAVDRSPLVLRVGEDRFVDTASLLRGRVLTHRVTAEELAQGWLPIHPDLSALGLRPHVTWPSDRGPVDVELGDEFLWRLRGAPGWLDDLSPGDLLGVARVSDELRLQRVDRSVAEPMTDAALRARLEHVLEPFDDDDVPSAQLAMQVHVVMDALPRSFTEPGPPVSERIGDAFETYRDEVGLAGTDWAEVDPFFGRYRFRDDRLDDDVLDFAKGWRLTDDQAEQLAELVRAADDLDEGTGVDELRARRLAATLDDETLGEALLVWSRTSGEPAAVLDLGQLLAAATRGSAAALCLTLAATAAEELGNNLHAEELVAAALAADRTHYEAHALAARYASDRGDAAAALRHLRALGLGHDHPDVRRMARFAEPPSTAVGRNQPCPCGSGRKHKACCLGSLRHPLADRASWLWQKLAEWCREPQNREVVLDAAMTLRPDLDPHEQVAMAMTDPVALDQAAWADGLVLEFDDARGDVLPDDERELLRQWYGRPLRLVEVVSTRPGTSLLVRDGTEELEVRDRAGSRDATPGELLLTRLLPDGGGATIASFVVRVPRTQAAAVRHLLASSDDPDVGVAEWYAAAHRPPDMRTKRGHEVVLCEGRWDVPSGALARLEAELGPAHDGAVHLVDGESGVATLAVDGHTLTVTAMSREDYATAAALVRRLVPGAEEDDLQAVPAAALMSGEVTPLRRKASGPDLAQDPAVLAAVRERIEAYEREWVDEQIPALGGLTPREALGDPTARRLLEQMLGDWSDDEQGMSPTRIRGLLGLT